MKLFLFEIVIRWYLAFSINDITRKTKESDRENSVWIVDDTISLNPDEDVRLENQMEINVIYCK